MCWSKQNRLTIHFLMQKTTYFCDEKNVPIGIRYPNSQLPPTNVFVHIMSVKIPVAITSSSPIANTPCWTSSTRHEKFFTSHHLPLLHFRPNPDAKAFYDGKDTIRNGTVRKRMGIRPDENNYNLSFKVWDRRVQPPSGREGSTWNLKIKPIFHNFHLPNLVFDNMNSLLFPKIIIIIQPSIFSPLQLRLWLILYRNQSPRSLLFHIISFLLQNSVKKWCIMREWPVS